MVSIFIVDVAKEGLNIYKKLIQVFVVPQGGIIVQKKKNVDKEGKMKSKGFEYYLIGLDEIDHESQKEQKLRVRLGDGRSFWIKRSMVKICEWKEFDDKEYLFNSDDQLMGEFNSFLYAFGRQAVHPGRMCSKDYRPVARLFVPNGYTVKTIVRRDYEEKFKPEIIELSKLLRENRYEPFEYPQKEKKEAV